MSLDNIVDGLCLRDLALYFSHNFLRCANGKTPLKDRYLKNLNICSFYTYIHTYIHTYIYIYIYKFELLITTTSDCDVRNKKIHKKILAKYIQIKTFFNKIKKHLQSID